MGHPRASTDPTVNPSPSIAYGQTEVPSPDFLAPYCTNDFLYTVFLQSTLLTSGGVGPISRQSKEET